MTEKPSPLCFDRVRSYAENQSTVHNKFIFSLDGSVGPPAEGPGRRPEQGDMRFCCCGGGSCCCCCCCCGGGCAVDGSGGGGGAGLEGISFAVRRGECVAVRQELPPAGSPPSESAASRLSCFPVFCSCSLRAPTRPRPRPRGGPPAAFFSPGGP